VFDDAWFARGGVQVRVRVCACVHVCMLAIVRVRACARECACMFAAFYEGCRVLREFLRWCVRVYVRYCVR